MGNVLDKSCRENQNTYIILINVFRKSFRLWDNIENCGGARVTTNNDEYGAYELHAG